MPERHLDPDDALGPVGYVVIAFPGDGDLDDGFTLLLDLVDRGVIRVLDLEFVARRADGTVGVVDAGGLGSLGGVDLAVFAGASSGILDAADIEQVGTAMPPGTVVAVLVYEQLALLPVVAAWERGGATLLADGPVLPDDLVHALDDTEPALAADPVTGGRRP